MTPAVLFCSAATATVLLAGPALAVAGPAPGRAAVPAVPAAAGPTRHVDLELATAQGQVLPAAGEIRAATATARDLGLEVDQVKPTSLRVSAPASVIARLFPSDGNAKIGAVDEVPPALSGLVSDAIDADNQTPVAQPHAFYSATDLATAYGSAEPGGYNQVRPALTAQSPIVATLQLSGLDTAALTTYAQQVVFPADPTYDPVTMPAGAPQFSAVGVDRPAGYDPSRDNDDTSSEFALDEEAILGAAPEARLRAYIATNTPAGFLDVFNDLLGDVTAGMPIVAFSTSWGSCEYNYDPRFLNDVEGVLTRLNAAGVTLFAASGDSGLRDCSPSGSHRVAVDFPASAPAVVGVGGTSHPDGSGPPAPDTAWTGPDPSDGSGGGTSIEFERPSYQALSGSGDGREVPDIALDADIMTGFGAYLPDHSNGGSSVDGPVAVGGTSLASPLAAALLTNVEVAHGFTGNPRGLGDIHRALYLAPRLLPGAITDVVSVNNNTAQTIYAPTVGYDRSTGLGTPDFAALAPLLYAAAPAVTAAPTISLASSIRGTVPSNAKVTFKAPAGVTASGYYVWLAGEDHGCVTGPFHRVDTLEGLPLGRIHLVIHSIGPDLSCSAGRSVSVRVGLDDRTSTRGRGWSLDHDNAAFGGTYLQSAIPGATVNWNKVDGRVYDVLLDRIKGSATVQILLDGRVSRTVALISNRTRWSQVTTVTAGRHTGHTISVRVVRGTVRVDGLLLH